MQTSVRDLIIEVGPPDFPDPDTVTFNCGSSLDVLYKCLAREASLRRKHKLYVKLSIGLALALAGFAAGLFYLLWRGA
jgi:hypothetical protein